MKILIKYSASNILCLKIRKGAMLVLLEIYQYKMNTFLRKTKFAK